ncbi:MULTISPECIES: PAS domain-containing sensor histidine kinase [unclassified Candidatus Frackibacter]|uniref:PAS domain-containing sensor histidine kinase n=1 Tax=unclassified Candidatus Frackibacter TaxID=2648818 RepID=UPI000886DCBD|nr:MULTISPECIES: PAS domain-containing sensor histidine kinase [unclassified Candidatus Frackibacter]SDC56559.1 PAS domain S-box-containing protein [Candidatus Frackibacter sp. WG11]SFL83510.1 PAS domain S-box-containing protein [Candidatus Frackibacter sp. WG13]
MSLVSIKKETEPLVKLIEDNQDFLIDRIIYYAKKHGYTQYTSTLREAWRISMSGLSKELVEFLKIDNEASELNFRKRINDGRIEAFTILEAQRHLKRGLSLKMFLSLIKYYKQSYIDLIMQSNFQEIAKSQYYLIIERFFDYLEIKIIEEWETINQNEELVELQAENRRLVNEKNKYLTILESVPEPVILVNNENKINNANSEALDILIDFHVPGETYYSQKLRGESLPWFEEELNKFAASNRSEAKFSKNIYTKNGLRFFEVKFKKMLDVSDKFSGTIIFFNDLTKRKEIEEKLNYQKEKLEKYLDISEVIFLVLDRYGKIVSVNKKGCEILNYSKEELINEVWINNFIVSEEREEAKENFKATINEGTASSRYIKRKILTKNGQKKKVNFHIATLKDGEGDIEGVIISGMDITEKELLKSELETNKLRTQFIANLSHEFKTPLNLIFSALQMLDFYQEKKLELEDSSKFKKYINTIQQNGYRLLKLVNNLVDITKINSDSFNLNLENYDIVKLIKDIVSSVTEYARNKDRKLELILDIKEREIACDPFNIERIMLNLLSNAIKFTDKGDKIIVSVYEKDKKVYVSVKDTGIGIPEDKQEIIFKRFGQVDKSFKRNSEGSGIGLTLVKMLIEMHNGEISLNSEYGKGSEFIIELPIKVLSRTNTKRKKNRMQRDFIDKIDLEFSDIYS